MGILDKIFKNKVFEIVLTIVDFGLNRLQMMGSVKKMKDIGIMIDMLKELAQIRNTGIGFLLPVVNMVLLDGRLD